MKIGAEYLGNGRCRFTAWAPLLNSVDLTIVSPREEIIPMAKDDFGYWRVTVDALPPGTLYFYQLEKADDRPDPASGFQPDGVHGPSQVVDHTAFKWEDASWQGIPFDKMIIYEIHTGTFTPEGTFDAIIGRLDDLAALGVTAIELMPVAQFPGERNWGYDGVFPFAPQNSYGGCDGLKRLVNACHRRGLAAILDVVYNHLGPEGCRLEEFAPYSTDKHKTAWGRAINFDDAYSYGVRDFFIENALSWFRHYHFDALRLDAIDHIHDLAAKPFLQELAERVGELSAEVGRKLYLTAEVDLNSPRYVMPIDSGGCGIDVQWCDDFHHALFTVLTGESASYYVDFGAVGQLVKALREGYVYTWQYSKYNRTFRGSTSERIAAGQLVVFIQNHDQVGNRKLGSRLPTLVPFDALKLAAATVLLSPYVPLLFMGEDYGEDSPFLYFTSHGDPRLIDAVRRGHGREVDVFGEEGEAADPQSVETFLRSKIKWKKRTIGKHKTMLEFYHALIALRREVPALATLSKDAIEMSGTEEQRVITMRRRHGASQVFCVMNFNPAKVVIDIDPPKGTWNKTLDSSEARWEGPGSDLPDQIQGRRRMTLAPFAVVVYQIA